MATPCFAQAPAPTLRRSPRRLPLTPTSFLPRPFLPKPFPRSPRHPHPRLNAASARTSAAQPPDRAATPCATRQQQALELRRAAAQLAHDRAHPAHVSNGSEELHLHPKTGAPLLLANFTKGLPHERDTGLAADAAHYDLFVAAVHSGLPDDIRAIPLGPQAAPGVRLPRSLRFRSGIARSSHLFPHTDVRAWESMAAGNAFDLQGPDAQAVTMPPAPALASPELALEMTENYWMALLRDVRFSQFAADPTVAAAMESMNATEWVALACGDASAVAEEERKRLRGPFTAQNVFRGNTQGDCKGPYISQFLLSGSAGLGQVNSGADGYIQYGAMRMDQRVRVALEGLDYMTTWESWLDVQNGADLRGRELYEDGERFRFICTPRDLATYVHYDALYQAYLNACIIMLNKKIPFDKGLPFQKDDDIDKQQGFALFGPPHILTLCTEVATRALKGIRFQKYNVHRRLRPEAVGGRVERYHHNCEDPLFADVKPLYDALDKDMLERVAAHNAEQNAKDDFGNSRFEDYSPTGSSGRTYLLPMAFPEGSPMHPAYGAGHAAVAGACTTILKAFFDHEHELDFAYVPTADGSKLEDVVDSLGEKLTVEGELNKVCSNISVGRNWAGVHYFTDYRESIILGEKIALGLLEEQKLTYAEEFSMTIPLFDGSTVTI
ncbi:vanadium-dependent bromoperoxidase, vBPO [Chondrus crispus]|uniref:Vanadium-dependent bromoperoxidase, vBPO n=1 Tax=Chondrus crispus TaxID=2769 RepID=R7QIP4_CHOCR|nr:vanadium-dependent bromoperoxidase, vBPO [Chondrus crispus]CDF37939.1 vanadium-dependent bromoperoxidase, vBPO [Chondrus crispus]|eukprot:XP_005719435.1 vanadium-dependent bromoperoxidase, vBPO [Chondrus crispus]